jgi:hypothetical protein
MASSDDSTRTSDLMRVKQIPPWTGSDYMGHSSEIVDLPGPSGTGWDSQPSQNRPTNCRRDKLPIGYAPVTWVN